MVSVIQGHQEIISDLIGGKQEYLTTQAVLLGTEITWVSHNKVGNLSI